MARHTNEQVVNAFMNQRPANGGALTTDGQSLFSYNLRIAEHIPDDYGKATTLVYDYTARGNAYKSQTTSQHVGMVKQRVPRRNVVLVETAVASGLLPQNRR
tara:strand:+ start:66 stop:371 length:306 start_codon:yes stop_codon:yes gene_type:complete